MSLSILKRLINDNFQLYDMLTYFFINYLFIYCKGYRLGKDDYGFFQIFDNLSTLKIITSVYWIYLLSGMSFIFS